MSPTPGFALPNFELSSGQDGATPLAASATPKGLNPSQVVSAYGINRIMFGNVTGDGRGQTIAIVDAFDDPTIKTDLANFNAAFASVDPALANNNFTFTVLNQTGGTTLPGTDPQNSWELEEALDVEWSHAIAPQANIILFEANSNSFANLNAAVTTAANMPGVCAISMSYGGGEFSTETGFDSVFTTPSGRTGGVTFFASTGDSGKPGGYPAYSPNVVAVGGTTLSVDSNGNYLGEQGWSGSGGGISQFEAKPAYQSTVTLSSTQRTIPDISFDADPHSGVAVYDSFTFGTTTPWVQVGGTSLSSPCWAGLMAIVDQGRAAIGQPSLDGPTQTLPALYRLPTTDFHDIVLGNNGFAAGSGYDLVTGRGSPIADILVPQLVGGAIGFQVTGLPTSSTAGNTVTFTVTAQTALAQTATDYLGTVHFTSSDAQAGLPADYTFKLADNGVHTFTVTLKTAGSQSFTATDSVTASTTGSQAGITVNPAAASAFVVTGFPSPTIAGVAGNFTITAIDAFNNTATGYNGTVHLTSSDPQAMVPSDSTLTNGVGTLTATFKTAGVQMLTATDSVAASVTGAQPGVMVNPAAASTFLVGGFPASIAAGVAGSVTVTAKDPFGNTASGYTGTVHFSTSDAQAILPPDSSLTNGVGSFSFTLGTVGTQGLTATDTLSATITGTQSGVVVNPGAATNLIVAGFPSSATAGVAGNITVTAKDGFGNLATGYTGTVHFTSSDGQAILPADATLTNGAGSFSVTLRTAGNQSLSATDTVTASIAGTESGISVSSASANGFVIIGFPASLTAGAAGSFTVTAVDSFGNPFTSYVGTVHFTSSDGQAALPADYTFTAADNGAHAFSATLKTGGNQTITASDTVTSSITGSQAGINVNPAAASKLQVSGFASPATAGLASSFTVTAQDAFNNTASGYLGRLRFTSSDPKAVLPANYTFLSADHGVHVFSATLKTAGTQSLTAVDTLTSSITGNQPGILVNPAAAAKFSVTAFPSPITAGVTGTLTATALDAFGNRVIGYLGTVHFTSTGSSNLPANYTFISGDQGVHTFGAALKTAGLQTITVNDTLTTSIKGSQSGIVVTAAATSQLSVSGFPSPMVAGTAGTFTVTAKDAFGNKTTSYLGTVHFTSSDHQAVLPADYTFAAGDNGVHTFSATLKTAAGQTITATDTLNSSITGKQAMSITAAAAQTLTVSGFTSPTTAGVSHSITVTAKDPFGNVATSYLGTATFSSSDLQAVLPANYTFLASDKGKHTFSAILKTAGSQSITATDTVAASITGKQTGITVTAAAASTLAVIGFPSSITNGTAGSFTVLAKDSFGNVATGYRGTVHFTSSDAQAVLPANYTFIASDKGTHVFSATLKSIGTQSITATDTATASINGSETGISVTSAPLNELQQAPLDGSDLDWIFDSDASDENAALVAETALSDQPLGFLRAAAHERLVTEIFTRAAGLGSEQDQGLAFLLIGALLTTAARGGRRIPFGPSWRGKQGQHGRSTLSLNIDSEL